MSRGRIHTQVADLLDRAVSEDIDLIAVGSRKDVAGDLDAALPRAVARTHGRLTVEPALSATRGHPAGPVAACRRTAGSAAAAVSPGSDDLADRAARLGPALYRPPPAAELLVPTLPAFAASKTATWADRLAPRDLWALGVLGAIDADAAELYRRYGPTRRAPGRYLFNRAPSDAQWQAQLGGQTRLTVSATQALKVVREAWRQATRPAPTLIKDE